MWPTVAQPTEVPGFLPGVWNPGAVGIVQSAMSPRHVVAALATVGLGLVAVACGSDDAQPASTGTDSTLPPVDDPVGYQHPTGADEVVVSYEEVGGFTTREFAFQRTPNVLVAGDGRAFSPGAQIEIYPGPLLPAVQVWTLGEDGIQDVLAAADDAGLLAEIEYDQPANIADATTAVVTIDANGETFVHEAYALGIGGGPGGAESTPERQALLDFTTELVVIASPGPTGDVALYEPDAYAIEALSVDDLSAYGSEIEPTVVDWPADASVRLADAPSCTVIAADEVDEVFATANQLTFFDDAGVVYQVLVRPVLPGRSC